MESRARQRPDGYGINIFLHHHINMYFKINLMRVGDYRWIVDGRIGAGMDSKQTSISSS